MQKIKGKKIKVNISVDVDLLERGRAKADKDNRAFSNYVETLIKADVEKDTD